LVKVESAALNPSDILFMKGLYKIKLDLPFTPGWEGSGTVHAVGEEKYKQALLGKRVAFMKIGELVQYKIGGAFADYALADVRGLIPIQDSISFDQAASSIVNPYTAICMVDRLVELKSKCTILTAAAS
jgi:NADPH:quinone reductase-like Zn-dependent oxidoreductase